MGILKDIAIAVPLGVIYNVFVHKLANISLSGMEYNEKYQKSIIILFVAGIVGIIIAQNIFARKSYYKNRPIRYGMIFGSVLLITYSLITNWDKMDDNTKLVLMGIIMMGLVWYCYYGKDDDKKKNRKKTEKN